MNARVDAGTKALWERSHDMPFSAASEGFKAPYRRESEAVIAAADAVMFGEGSMRRAYEVLKHAVEFTPYNTTDPEIPDEDPYENGLRAVIAALKGEES